MNNDSTIPSRLDPMHTMPVPLAGLGPTAGRREQRHSLNPWAWVVVAVIVAAGWVAVLYYAAN